MSMCTSRTASRGRRSTRRISTTRRAGWRGLSTSRSRRTPRCRGWRCDSHPLTARAEGGDLLLDASTHDVRVDQDVTLELYDRAAPGGVRFATAEQDGARYLMLRYRPELPAEGRRQRRDWVFLF